MSQYFSIHPDNPQPRLARRAAEMLAAGRLIVYPTDSCYALGCRLGDKAALERMRRLRQVDDKHAFTLMCADLGDIATYAQVDNTVYRLLKTLTPGPFTFILPASRELPRITRNRRGEVGIRVPDSRIAHALLAEHGEPIVSSTLLLPGDEAPLTDSWEIRERLEHEVDLVVDGGFCGWEMTTVLDLTGPEVQLRRAGRGDASAVL